MPPKPTNRHLWRSSHLSLLHCCAILVVAAKISISMGGDPYAYFDWKVSYLTGSPFGVKQKVIGINGQFPGPTLNLTTGWNVAVNVHNDLDEPLLITWDGLQQRSNSWQDGVLGTNCPIPSGWNWTYEFKVKDQIGSFFYFPSINFQRAGGGYGGIIVNNRYDVPVPFGKPDGDITIFISDWYMKNHKILRKDLDDGKALGAPDGVVINGFGPYPYGQSNAPTGKVYQTINVEPGKTYRFRVHNVGVSASLNFRIQNHNLILVETEGSYTIQQNYTNMDIHVGQSYSFLVTMDQSGSSDYYIAAIARFVDPSVGNNKATGVALLHYSNSQGAAAAAAAIGPLPVGPDEGDMQMSMNQAKSIRWNLSSGAARPNPQGSFRYGEIAVTQVYLLRSRSLELINGKLRATINGISYLAPETPPKLAQQLDLPGVFKLDFPERPMEGPAKLDTSFINATYRGFMEIVFQNDGSTIQSYHMDGYAFFVVGMDFGNWSEDSRAGYNKLDAVARCTTQVYPGAWTAILVSLDNPGTWNLRSQNLDLHYLGQELYISVVNPEKSEDPMPDNTLFCGQLSNLQRQQFHRFTYSPADAITVKRATVLCGLLLAVVACYLLPL